MEKGHGLRPVAGELRRKAPLAHALRHAGLHGPADGLIIPGPCRRIGKACVAALGQAQGPMEKGHDLRPVTGELRRKASLAHALRHAGLHSPADGPLQLPAHGKVGKAALLLRRVGAARRTVKKQRQLPPGAGSLRPKKGRFRLRNALFRRPAKGLRIISALRCVKKRKRQRRAIQSLQIQNRPAVHRPCRK